jgi:ABC-2 type transport system permease protein
VIIPSLRALRALFGLNLSLSLQYRAQSILWMVAGLTPLIMMMVWLQLAKDGPIGGYDALTFAQYFLFMFFCRQITPSWVIYLLDRGVKHGELSPYLLQPMHPVWHYVMMHLGEMTLRLPIVGTIVVAGLSLADAWTWSLLANLPAFLMALALAWIINFTVHLVVGLLAFWTDNALGYDTFVYQLYIMLGGVIVPVELFPETVRSILYWTPFPYILDFPVRVMIGRIPDGGLWQGLGVQLLWIGILLALFLVIWRAGLRRYSGAGA